MSKIGHSASHVRDEDAKKKLGQIIAQLDVIDMLISEFSATRPG
jgi:hypothetical protein